MLDRNLWYSYTDAMHIGDIQNRTQHHPKRVNWTTQAVFLLFGLAIAKFRAIESIFSPKIERKLRFQNEILTLTRNISRTQSVSRDCRAERSKNSAKYFDWQPNTKSSPVEEHAKSNNCSVDKSLSWSIYLQDLTPSPNDALPNFPSKSVQW